MSRALEYAICAIVLAALGIWIYGVTRLARGETRQAVILIVVALAAFVVVWVITAAALRHHRKVRLGAGLRPRRSQHPRP